MAVSQYEILATLKGPQDAVLSVAFAAHGKFLSATGYHGVSVWDLKTFSPVSGPSHYFAPMKAENIYPTSAWIYFAKNSRHVLLLGSLEGRVIAWDWNDKKSIFECSRQNAPRTPNQQVLSIDVHRVEVAAGHRARAAVAFADRSISVWTLSAEGEFVNIFSITLEAPFMPKTVRFEQRTRNVYAFAMTGGKVSMLDHKTGAVVWWKNDGPEVMASVSMHQSSDHLVASTGKDFQIFKISSLTYIRTLEGDNPVVLFPKHVAFAEEGNMVVAGTDRGQAVIYDTHAGTLVQVLDYPKGGLVQPVTTCTLDDRYFVAIAGSASQRPAEVIIWQKTRPLPPVHQPVSSQTLTSTQAANNAAVAGSGSTDHVNIVVTIRAPSVRSCIQFGFLLAALASFFALYPFFHTCLYQIGPLINHLMATSGPSVRDTGAIIGRQPEGYVKINHGHKEEVVQPDSEPISKSFIVGTASENDVVMHGEDSDSGFVMLGYGTGQNRRVVVGNW